jgi:hypothetical protein
MPEVLGQKTDLFVKGPSEPREALPDNPARRGGSGATSSPIASNFFRLDAALPLQRSQHFVGGCKRSDNAAPFDVLQTFCQRSVYNGLWCEDNSSLVSLSLENVSDLHADLLADASRDYDLILVLDRDNSHG